MSERVEDSAALLIVLLRFNTTLSPCERLHRSRNQHRSQSIASFLFYKSMCDSGASQQNSVEVVVLLEN